MPWRSDSDSSSDEEDEAATGVPPTAARVRVAHAVGPATRAVGRDADRAEGVEEEDKVEEEGDEWEECNADDERDLMSEDFGDM